MEKDFSWGIQKVSKGENLFVITEHDTIKIQINLLVTLTKTRIRPSDLSPSLTVLLSAC